jgi:TPR repeat protein
MLFPWLGGGAGQDHGSGESLRSCSQGFGVLRLGEQSYFQVAARLGDCDAQQELAFCYLNGKGCKKDMKQAARWYRAAVSFDPARICAITDNSLAAQAAQGASTVGLAWIYKPKYA